MFIFQFVELIIESKVDEYAPVGETLRTLIAKLQQRNLAGRDQHLLVGVQLELHIHVTGVSSK